MVHFLFYNLPHCNKNLGEKQRAGPEEPQKSAEKKRTKSDKSRKMPLVQNDEVKKGKSSVKNSKKNGRKRAKKFVPRNKNQEKSKETKRRGKNAVKNA